MTNNNTLWQTKVAARLHDPAEKALVLMRDPAGHENGTSLALTRLLGFQDIDPNTADPDNDEALVRTVFKNSLPKDMYRRVQHADWWAAAADRPQFPMDEIEVEKRTGDRVKLKVARWAQVHWTNQPILIHPLTGEKLNLWKLADTDINEIKQYSFDHLARLLVSIDKDKPGQLDWHKTLLALWRFGPYINEDTDAGQWGALWEQLPADTRIPDHSIWDHLDLTSAFSGAFTADNDGQVALLSLAIGPVQPFIAAARKMEDLWAGSHLLARLSWEAMKVVCEELGPDAILFPRLRGVPQVDLWLRDEIGLPDKLFKDCDWQNTNTDSNPLFSAALPNRFVALVPEDHAAAIAEKVEQAVRRWLNKLGDEVVIALLKEAGYEGEEENIETPYQQMKEQLKDFPEVHWAAVPFSLIDKDSNQKVQSTVQLSEAMQPFFAGEEAPGFLGSSAWNVLKDELTLDNDDGSRSTFFAPNPGTLYAAVHDLAERVLAAAKATRPFSQVHEEGYRCSMTGETEWLTTDRNQLKSSYRNQSNTLWATIAKSHPAWAKEGEHLGALPAIKRLWPNLFAEEVGKALGTEDTEPSKNANRFSVSTHTMALAHQLDQWLAHEPKGEQRAAYTKIADELTRHDRTALPRKLALRAQGRNEIDTLARIPAWLDAASESDDDAERVRNQLKDLFGGIKPETYYTLVKMDGDHMGAWLAGGDDKAITYAESFHPQVKVGFDKRAAKQPTIKRYGDQKRAVSPNRHLAISGALNDFSLTVVRHIVEREFLGRLIYAGGDDVFAMLPVADTLPAIERLRHAYSGTLPADAEKDMDWGRLRKHDKRLHCKSGFAWLNGQLMRMMGEKATASCGVVIAHHQAPLTTVRRELDAAEARAKNDGGRDAFAITIIKRSGGTLYFTDKWGEPLRVLCALRDFLVQDGVSRRAVYHTLQWLDDKQLPPESLASGLAETLLAYQLQRQTQNKALKATAATLAHDLLALVPEWQEHAPQTLTHKDIIKRLRNPLQVAEFLARETRTASAASAPRIEQPDADEPHADEEDTA